LIYLSGTKGYTYNGGQRCAFAHPTWLLQTPLKGPSAEANCLSLHKRFFQKRDTYPLRVVVNNGKDVFQILGLF